MRPAVVLLSGGLDSTTVLAMAQRQGFACHALSFDYGQRHAVELRAAERVARSLGVASHRVVPIGLDRIGGSALTDDIEVPKDRPLDDSVPVTYVPARNTIFLSIALGVAEVVGATDLFAGMNAVDYSGYPDCRPEFIQAFETLAQLATKAGVEGVRYVIHTPLIQMRKPEIIQAGLELGIDYSITHSCYDPIGSRACGHCDSCMIRRSAFTELGLEDPALA